MDEFTSFLPKSEQTTPRKRKVSPTLARLIANNAKHPKPAIPEKEIIIHIKIKVEII